VSICIGCALVSENRLCTPCTWLINIIAAMNKHRNQTNGLPICCINVSVKMRKDLLFIKNAPDVIKFEDASNLSVLELHASVHG
jgi:hypothetical protein